MKSLIKRVSRHDPKCTKVEIPLGRNYSAANNDITQDELIRLVEALKRNRIVRKIDFYYARRSTELFRGLDALFRVNTVIQCIQLPHRTSNEELLLIEEGLRDNATVTKLELRFCDIQGHQGGEIIRRVLLSNGTITEIDLDRNVNLGADGAVGLAQALRNERCVLKKLDLWLCGIGNDGARELKNALQNNTVMEELRIGRIRITFTGFRHIMEMLETNSCLKVLFLAYNTLNQDQTGNETAGDLLERALQHNASLRELDLTNCYLSAANLSSVFLALTGDNHTLTRLSIANNKMDEASTNNFARLLPQMKGPEEIDFSWYKGVSATVLRGLLDGLLDNKSLVRVRATNVAALQGKGSQALWYAWSTFVARRNRMRPLLEGNNEASGGGRRDARPAQPVPASLWPSVLKWCCNEASMQAADRLILFYNDEQNGSSRVEEAKASLIHHMLCTRANDIFRLGGNNNSKRPAPEV